MKQTFYNMIIHTTEGTHCLGDWETDPPIQSKVQINEDLLIVRLPNGEAHSIMTACEPPGFNFSPARQYTQMYTFMRSNAPDNYEWDVDGVLNSLLALSRIVQPTTISYAYSAIVIKDEQDKTTQIIPGPVGGPGSDVYIADDNRRNWLNQLEASQLKKLYTAYQTHGLSDPLSTALWYHEYCTRQYYVDVRWALVSTALESIVHVERYKSTRQFAKRIPMLAKEVKTNITEEEANDFYNLRSEIIHSGMGKLEADHKRLYIMMEDLLRRAITRGIYEPDFSSFLANRDQIRNTWTLA